MLGGSGFLSDIPKMAFDRIQRFDVIRNDFPPSAVDCTNDYPWLHLGIGRLELAIDYLKQVRKAGNQLMPRELVAVKRWNVGLVTRHVIEVIADCPDRGGDPRVQTGYMVDRLDREHG